MHLHHCLYVTLLISSTVLAQEPPKSETWLPKTGPDYVVDFSLLSIAKTSLDGNAILMARPTYKSETRTRMISKVSYTTETRQRTVRDNDGKDVIQNYTVQVPVTTNEAQQYVVRSPDGSVKLRIPFDKVRAWDLEGNKVSTASLKKRLEKPTHVLASESDPQFEYRPSDPYFRSILRLDTLVLYIPPGASISFADKASNDQSSKSSK